MVRRVRPVRPRSNASARALPCWYPGTYSDRSPGGPIRAMAFGIGVIRGSRRGRPVNRQDAICGRPPACKRVQVVGRIACAHMSGFGALIGRCRAGFRDVHSKQGGDIDCRGVFRSVARLGSTDHTISSFSGKFRLWRVVVVTARQTARSVSWFDREQFLRPDRIAGSAPRAAAVKERSAQRSDRAAAPQASLTAASTARGWCGRADRAHAACLSISWLAGSGCG